MKMFRVNVSVWIKANDDEEARKKSDDLLHGFEDWDIGSVELA